MIIDKKNIFSCCSDFFAQYLFIYLYLLKDMWFKNCESNIMFIFSNMYFNL